MKTNIALLNRAGRWFGAGRMMKPNSLFRRLAGNLPGVLLWLAALPLAALGQANYDTPYTFTTLAGVARVAGTNDGTGSAARFYEPGGVALDSVGNLYVSDEGNNTIRKVTPGGAVTTLAGRAGTAGSADGTNSAARFNDPCGLAVDTNGNIYVADFGNDTIRKVSPVGTNWVVTTLAGYALNVGSADGTNRAARFNGPVGVAVDTNGNIYVGDGYNNTIRKVSPVGTNWVVTTLAGQVGVAGSADGTNGAAQFYGPCQLVLDNAGNLFVTDFFNNTIRKVTPLGTNWVVTTLAGMPGYTGGETGNTGSADGTNSAARFNWPWGVAVDSSGNVYVGDQINYTIRRLTPVGTNWVVTTLAGLAKNHGYADGTGSAARFYDPVGVAVDTNGNVYVTEYSNYTIRKGFPATSVPPPILQPPSLSAGQFGFGITGLPGLAVNIESSSNLSNWQVVGTYILDGIPILSAPIQPWAAYSTAPR
jgi:streptogramin lyase